jgi:hypothetical protein
MQSCHDLHLHSSSDLEAFSFSSPIHWDLSSNLCCCSSSIDIIHLTLTLMICATLQSPECLVNSQRRNRYNRECLSTLRITTEEYEASDCISRASTSLVWHVWWVKPQCHHLLKVSSVNNNSEDREDSKNNETMRSEDNKMTTAEW